MRTWTWHELSADILEAWRRLKLENWTKPSHSMRIRGRCSMLSSFLPVVSFLFLPVVWDLSITVIGPFVRLGSLNWREVSHWSLFCLSTSVKNPTHIHILTPMGSTKMTRSVYRSQRIPYLPASKKTKIGRSKKLTVEEEERKILGTYCECRNWSTVWSRMFRVWGKPSPIDPFVNKSPSISGVCEWIKTILLVSLLVVRVVVVVH